MILKTRVNVPSLSLMFQNSVMRMLNVLTSWPANNKNTLHLKWLFCFVLTIERFLRKDGWLRTVGSFPFLCTDINECKMNNGGCQDKCINSPGSFSCLCTRLGFVVAADNKSCISEFVPLCVMPRTLPSLSGCLPYLFICSFYLSFSIFLSLLSFFSFSSLIISCLSFIFLYPFSSVFLPFLSSVLPSTSPPSFPSLSQVNLPYSVQVVDSVCRVSLPLALHLPRGQTSKLLTQLQWWAVCRDQSTSFLIY